MDFNLNQIRNFITVAQTLNFSNAARQNGVPQSTVSRQVNDLEQQLGVRLFYRTKRDVKLTEEGRTFLPYAKELLEAAGKGAYLVRQLHDGASGRLRIAAVESAGVFLAQCLRAFARKYPDVVVDLAQVSDGDPLQEEGEDPFDFHFMQGDMLPELERYGSLVTNTDTLGVVVARDHPLAEKTLELEALQQEKFILLSEEENPILYMQTMDLCQAYHFTPRVVGRYDTAKSVLLAVGAGLGVTILPLSLPRMILPELVRVLPIDEMDTGVPYVVAWKKELLNPAASLFLDVVRAQLEQKM